MRTLAERVSTVSWTGTVEEVTSFDLFQNYSSVNLVVYGREDNVCMGRDEEESRS